MTQEDLSKIVGITKAAISRYELSERKIGKIQMFAIATALEVDVTDLTPDDEPPAHDTARTVHVRRGSRTDQMLKLMAKLNEDGLKKAVSHVKELTEIPRFKKQNGGEPK